MERSRNRPAGIFWRKTAIVPVASWTLSWCQPDEEATWPSDRWRNCSSQQRAYWFKWLWAMENPRGDRGFCSCLLVPKWSFCWGISSFDPKPSNNEGPQQSCSLGLLMFVGCFLHPWNLSLFGEEVEVCEVDQNTSDTSMFWGTISSKQIHSGFIWGVQFLDFQPK